MRCVPTIMAAWNDPRLLLDVGAANSPMTCPRSDLEAPLQRSCLDRPLPRPAQARAGHRDGDEAHLVEGLADGRFAFTGPTYAAGTLRSVREAAHRRPALSDVATEREGAPELSPAAPPDLTRLLLAAIGGDRERFVLVERDTALDEIDVAVVIADGALDPTELAPLVGADVPHLPVVPRPGGVDVGPLVVPGESACFSCVELERSERDAAWPAIADQLREARPRPLPTERALRAAAAALDLLDEAWRGRTTGAVITIERETRARVVPPHAACGCRAPQRSASAPAASAAEHADRPVRTLPTTERAHAVPA